MRFSIDKGVATATLHGLVEELPPDIDPAVSGVYVDHHCFIDKQPLRLRGDTLCVLDHERARSLRRCLRKNIKHSR